MNFNVYNEKGEESKSGSDVDWDGLAKHVFETADLEEPCTLRGVVSGIYDLGVQKQDDAKIPSDLTPEQEEEETKKNPQSYFKTEVDYNDPKRAKKRFKFFPVKDQQCIAYTIDFPSIIVDKAKYFGKESDPRPLRMVLGGEFNPKGSKNKIVSRPLPLIVRNNEKTNNKWSMPFNSTLYKMAVAAKIISQGEPFARERVGELLGKTLLFKAQVSLNEGKYLNEKCAFIGAKARDQSDEVLDDSLIHSVQFTVQNDKKVLEEMRASIKNTMKMAVNWESESSIIREQFEELGWNDNSNSNDNKEGDNSEEQEESKSNQEKDTPKKTTPKKIESAVEDDDDEDPFAE